MTLYSVRSHMYGDYKTDISFVVAQGTLLWQPVKFGRFCKLRVERPLLFASAFDMTTDWPIVNPLSISSNAIIMVNRVQFGEIPSNNLRHYAIKTQFLPRFARNLSTIFIRHVGVSKRIRMSQF